MVFLTRARLHVLIAETQRWRRRAITSILNAKKTAGENPGRLVFSITAGRFTLVQQGYYC